MPATTTIPWKAIATIRKGLDAPIVIKGVMSAEDARIAVNQGAHGIVVSDRGVAGKTSPIEILPSIVDVVSGKATVLVDGGFRRGSDIAKALALGAQGALVARQVMWGLAAYGADGVQAVVELLQSDLGRSMGALGAPNLKTLTRSTDLLGSCRKALAIMA
jgi:isopentenyl diphosphate isomerase/L-lactate dehydrogenase-like FMN-dependent dehydrogenase